MPPKLSINVDHVATLRNARGGLDPCPVQAAKISQHAGASSITVHLREDRRHIKLHDVFRIKETIDIPLNFEMAATEEMQKIAYKLKPDSICIVPERRQELTTEGGLDIESNFLDLFQYISKLKEQDIKISLFLNPNKETLDKAKELNVDIVELHTGTFAHTFFSSNQHKINLSLSHIEEAAHYAHSLGLEVHAGHGLAYNNIHYVSNINVIQKLHIGHSLIADSIIYGLHESITRIIKKIDN